MITKKKSENILELQVKDLAKVADVSTDAVRFYTKKELLKPRRNKQNNYQLYNRTDLIRLRFIIRAKILGYTLNEIKQIFRASENKKTPCPFARNIIKNRIDSNKKHLREALALQKRMEVAIQKWEHMPDAIPVGDSICYLIEQATGQNFNY